MNLLPGMLEDALGRRVELVELGGSGQCIAQGALPQDGSLEGAVAYCTKVPDDVQRRFVGEE